MNEQERNDAAADRQAKQREWIERAVELHAANEDRTQATWDAMIAWLAGREPPTEDARTALERAEARAQATLLLHSMGIPLRAGDTR